MAREFFVKRNSPEIFRVFEGLAKDCISISCKHIENRPEKDGVFFRKNEELVVLKRSLSSQKTSFSSEKTPFFHSRQPSYHFEIAILHENHLKTWKNSVEILFSYSCFLIKEIMMYIFLFCQFDNSHYRTFRPLLKNSSISSYREYSQKHIDTPHSCNETTSNQFLS